MKKTPTPQERQKRIIRELAKREKDSGASYDTPLAIAVERAQNAHDDDEYWRLWESLYKRIAPLFTSQNALKVVLDGLDAPLYLEREMSGTYWKD